MIECRDCRYWESNDEEGILGICRRFAPRPTLLEYGADIAEDLLPKWPVTQKAEWCGEAVGPAVDHRSAGRSVQDT
jgi:hypothetical protein